MLASIAGDIAAGCSVAIAFCALAVSVRSNRHASRSAVASETSAAASVQAAQAAERTARAEERTAEIEHARFEQEQAVARQRQEVAAFEANAARIVLRTERSLRPTPPTFGDSEQFDYWLIVANTGSVKADRVTIGSIACNGSGERIMPVGAVDGRQFHPTESLLPGREWRIQLARPTAIQTYDLAQARVGWTDLNGAHEETLWITKCW